MNHFASLIALGLNQCVFQNSLYKNPNSKAAWRVDSRFVRRGLKSPHKEKVPTSG